MQGSLLRFLVETIVKKLNSEVTPKPIEADFLKRTKIQTCNKKQKNNNKNLKNLEDAMHWERNKTE